MKKNSSLTILIAILFVLCGIAIFVYFEDSTIKVLGVLAVIVGVTYGLMQWNKQKDNFDLNEDFFKEETGSTITDDEDQDKLRIVKKKGSDPEIKIKKTEETETKESNSDSNNVRIISENKEIKYKYSENSNESKVEKPEKGKIISSVRNTSSQNFIEVDYSNDIFMQEDDGKIIGSEPRREFEFFISKILKTIHALTKTRSAVFVLFDKKSNSYNIESFVTTNSEAITEKVTYDIANDIISKTIETQQPVLLSEINPNTELDLLPYYSKHVGTLSVITIPVFRWDGIIGVLCLDSNFAGAYTTNTIKLLEQFTSLLTAAITSYVNKYELLQAAKTLEAISYFYYNSSSSNINKIFDNLIETIEQIFEFSNLGICTFDETRNNWLLSKVKSNEKVLLYAEGCIANLKNSLIGNSIINNQVIKYNFQTPNNEMRICQNEPALTKGMFIAIPIASEDNTFGSFFLIDENRSDYNDFEIGILKTLGYHVGIAIDKIRLIDILNNSAIMDSNTRMLNSIAFYQRLEEELLRANDFRTNLVLCLFDVDKYSSVNWDDNEISDIVMHNIFDKTMKKMRIYDLLGKTDIETFGIVLIDKTKTDAKIWADSLRKEIANNFLELKNQKFSVTISIGLTEYRNGLKINEFINNAQNALNEAKIDGNKVCTY